MTGFTAPPSWHGPSTDPEDEQFGDLVASVSLDAASPRDLSDFDAALVGEPYDGAVVGRRGAEAGPAMIRESLAAVKTHHFDAGPVSAVGDVGDVEIPTDASVREVQAVVQVAASLVYGSGGFPVFLGGDNSLTVGNVAPLLDGVLRERGASGPSEDAPTVGVLNLDAHLDCRAERPDVGPTSGTPYRQLFDAGLDAYAVLGARHFETSTAYHDYLREQGGTVVTAEEVGEDPVAATDRALDALDGVDALYVSLDVDVLDAAAAPGVSAPTPGGLTTRECYRVLRLVAADPRVVGFEVVECAPPLDESGRTADAAARAVAHVLAARSAAVDQHESRDVDADQDVSDEEVDR